MQDYNRHMDMMVMEGLVGSMEEDPEQTIELEIQETEKKKLDAFHQSAKHFKAYNDDFENQNILIAKQQNIKHVYGQKKSEVFVISKLYAYGLVSVWTNCYLKIRICYL